MSVGRGAPELFTFEDTADDLSALYIRGSPMPRGHGAVRPPSKGWCVMLAAVSVVVLVLVFSQRSTGSRMRERAIYVSSFLARGGARTSRGGIADRHMRLDPEAAAALASCDNLTVLTPCTDGSCESYRDLPEDSGLKSENQRSVSAFLAEHPRSVIMVFAPWCSHCHTAMPHFIRAAKRSSIQFGIVNAELVPRSFLAGQDATLKVTHFPFFVKCTLSGESTITQQAFSMQKAATEDNLADFANAETDELAVMFS